MKRSFHAPIAPGKLVGAWVCLLAVVLLWTPMWAAAWAARGMSCCTGNMCAVHGHGKTDASGKNEAAKQNVPMECQHSQGAGMAACSISCCHDQSPSLVSSGVFVMPKPAAISLPAETVNSMVAVKCEEALLVIAPPSPPPKTAFL